MIKRFLFASAFGLLFATPAQPQTPPAAPETTSGPVAAPVVTGSMLARSQVVTSAPATPARRMLFGRLRGRMTPVAPLMTTRLTSTLPSTSGTIISTPGTGDTLPGTIVPAPMPAPMPTPMPKTPVAPTPRTGGTTMTPPVVPGVVGTPGVVTAGGTDGPNAVVTAGGTVPSTGTVVTAGGTVPSTGTVMPASGSNPSTGTTMTLGSSPLRDTRMSVPGTVVTVPGIGSVRSGVVVANPVTMSGIPAANPAMMMTTVPTTVSRMGLLGRLRLRR